MSASGLIDRPAVEQRQANASWTEECETEEKNGGGTDQFSAVTHIRSRLSPHTCLIALRAGLLAGFEKRFANSDGEGNGSVQRGRGYGHTSLKKEGGGGGGISASATRPNFRIFHRPAAINIR